MKCLKGFREERVRERQIYYDREQKNSLEVMFKRSERKNETKQRPIWNVIK